MRKRSLIVKIYRHGSLGMFLSPIILKTPSSLSFQHLPDCGNPYKLFSNLQTSSSFPSVVNPSGCSMYTGFSKFRISYCRILSFCHLLWSSSSSALSADQPSRNLERVHSSPGAATHPVTDTPSNHCKIIPSNF